MAKKVIELNHVSKIYKLFGNDKKRFLATFNKSIKYKEKIAINDITFSVDKGESVAIFGRNGAGKSTILKMITGVSYPTYGEIHVDGRVGALLELTSGFDPEFTGRENIYLKGQLIGLTNPEIEEVENEIIDFAEVGEYIDQPLRTYSSGMKSRLGFSISLALNPDIFIVDEALSVGDKGFAQKCMKRMMQLRDEENKTIFFISHSLSQVRSFCKTGMWIEGGKLVEIGDIDEVSDHY